jgi:membrane protein
MKSTCAESFGITSGITYPSDECSSDAYGTGALLAGVGAAWGALNGTWAIISGLNKAYEVEEERSWQRASSIVLGLTVSLGVLGLIGLAALWYGGQAQNIIGRHLGASAHIVVLGRLMSWVVIVTLLVMSFAVLYPYLAELKRSEVAMEHPRRCYRGSSQRIYGGLNAVATLLLWLYLTGAAIFIGGEANSEIEKAASEAGHADVRGAGERRSGGEGGLDS